MYMMKLTVVFDVNIHYLLVYKIEKERYLTYFYKAYNCVLFPSPNFVRRTTVNKICQWYIKNFFCFRSYNTRNVFHITVYLKSL